MRMIKVTRLGTIPLSSNRWERGYCFIFAKESKILLNSMIGGVWRIHNMRLNWETASSTFWMDGDWEWKWWECEEFWRKDGKLGMERETENLSLHFVMFMCWQQAIAMDCVYERNQSLVFSNFSFGCYSCMEWKARLVLYNTSRTKLLLLYLLNLFYLK